MELVLGRAAVFALAVVIMGLAGLAIVAEAASLGRRSGIYVAAQPPPPITNATFGTPLQFNGNIAGNSFHMDGDTYGNTWSDNGNTYTMINDSQSGPNGTVSGGGNVMFGRISTFDSTAVWTLVNQMTAWGTFADYTGSPAASHKTGGLISVQNNLYMVGWRLDQANGSHGYDGILLKSVDHGANFTPVPPSGALPYPSGTIMWPGYDYPIGWVQYGQNYTGNGPDNSGTYVYATIRNTSGGASQNPRLGRVAIANIANQSIGDWTYYQGPGGTDGNCGSPCAAWGPLSTAYITFPGIASGDAPASIQYLPRYQQYVAFMGRVATSGYDYVWDVFTAYHPWGPWTQVATSPHWNPSALSFPFIAPKSLVNGGQSLVVLASSSNFATGCTTSSGYYCLWQVPVSFTP